MPPHVLGPDGTDSPEEARDFDATDHAGVHCVLVADFLAFRVASGGYFDVSTRSSQNPVIFMGAFPPSTSDRHRTGHANRP